VQRKTTTAPRTTDILAISAPYNLTSLIIGYIFIA